MKEFRIYKPTKNNDGAASKLQVRMSTDKYPELLLFWEIAAQTGTDANDNSTFDWYKKGELHKCITMKLGLPDIGELLLVLNGRKEYVGPPPRTGQTTGGGMFHENQAGNTVLQFSKMKDRDGFYAGMSSKRNGEVTRIKHAVSAAEGMVLEQLLRDFISRYHGWTTNDKTK